MRRPWRLRLRLRRRELFDFFWRCRRDSNARVIVHVPHIERAVLTSMFETRNALIMCGAFDVHRIVGRAAGRLAICVRRSAREPDTAGTAAAVLPVVAVFRDRTVAGAGAAAGRAKRRVRACVALAPVKSAGRIIAVLRRRDGRVVSCKVERGAAWRSVHARR